LLDQPVAAFDGLAALHHIAVVVIGRPGCEIAIAVGEALVELGREAVQEVVQNIFTRRDVNLERRSIRPDRCRRGGATAALLRSRRSAPQRHGHRQVLFDRGDQGRRFHRSNQVVEEALLGRFERRACCRLRLAVERALAAGDVRCFQRVVEIVVNDLKGPGIGIVDADLVGGQLVFDQLIFDAFVGQRAGGIEAERLEVACQHFHRRDPARFDGRDEVGALVEREVRAAPQAEPLRIGKVLDRGCPGCRDVENAGIGQRVLQAQPGASLLRGSGIAPV
jgi:hypothetical protein